MAWQLATGAPRKINIEPQNDGLVQMIFLFKQVTFLGSII